MAALRPPSPFVVVCFLCLATCTQVLLALYGLLSRYAQVKASPPVPALRLVVVTNLIAEATLLVFHVAPLLIRKHVRRWRQQRQPQPALPSQGEQLEAGPCATSARPADGGVGSGSGSEQGSADASPKAGQASVAACCHTVVRLADPPPRAAEGDAEGQEKQQSASPRPHTQPRPSTAKSSVRAPMPLLRGLTRRVDRWERERPLLRRRLALAAITITFMGCCSLQILAPGFVDVSIVMLTTQWTTLGIALAQALLLRHRLPRAFWPCAAVMLGGAAMVIAPAVSQSTSGSLSTARGWWGFAMAIGALLSTVAYYVLLQACRHMGFTALQLQHSMNCASVLFYLPLTLPVDGTAWGAQFAGWSAADWAALLGLSTVAYMGSGVFMQLCVWRLGAPTASMFFGLRLVFSVVLSTPILGSTIIQTGVQIAGVAITAAAVTAYAVSQWWAARQAPQQQEQQQEQEHRQEHWQDEREGRQPCQALQPQREQQQQLSRPSQAAAAELNQADEGDSRV